MLSRHLHGYIIVTRENVSSLIDDYRQDCGRGRTTGRDSMWRGYRAHAGVWKALRERGGCCRSPRDDLSPEAPFDGPTSRFRIEARLEAFSIELQDPLRSAFRTLMFPDSEDPPSQLPQALVAIAIPRLVLVDLLPPPIAIRLWLGAMHWAAMPEASVYEDC
jgi:hypothetical protein